ncbi:hypothetical protein [Ruegeria atlantica]|uniref:hypothetical protein n=1 Tax=Ruegeria atlantica TaxID=81569 RepID=UPI001481963F|nr:hypothetical protein [Ruegeria atlantica]
MLDLATLTATRHDGHNLLRWGDDLVVMVFDTGEIGQFSATGAWSRSSVETAVRKALGRQASPTPYFKLISS